MDTHTDEIFTIAEAAKFLKIGRTMLFEIMARGELATLRVGRRRLIPRAALEQFVAERTETGAGQRHIFTP